MPETVTCRVCRATNPAGVQFCESCGVELAAARTPEEPEIDKLLESLRDLKPGKAEAGEREGLDIDKEIVDELLDSLLVEEPAEHFDCPLCGTKLPLDSKMCTKCGATFAEVPQGPRPAEVVPAPRPTEVARAPRPAEVATPIREAPVVTRPPRASRPPPRSAPQSRPSPPAGPSAPVEEVAPAPMPAPVPVALTEEPAPTLRLWSGRLIDIVVFGTIGVLVAIFFGSKMYSWDALARNPGTLGAFGGVALGGMAAGFVLFRISTGEIAQGDQLVKEGRYDDALYHYDRAIRMGSKPASAWTSKGVALKRLGQLDQALRCHNVAIKLDPENEIAWCNKGDIYFRAGEMDKAIECYDKAIALRPRYAIAWNNKGAALARMNRFEEARTCHDEAVTLKPRYVAAWLNRGEVLARLGLRDEAQECLDRARALGPT